MKTEEEKKGSDNLQDHYRNRLIQTQPTDRAIHHSQTILPPADPLPGCCRSCLFYTFCCCCSCCRLKVPTSRENWIQRFSRWIKERKADEKGDQAEPFQVLLRLYAHENCIDELKECRLNPDFTNLIGKLRNDLEFYIPQLVSFFLFGNFEHNQSLLKFILLASSSNFFFSHLVWFNFESFIDPANVNSYDKIKMMMGAIKQVCENSDELIYLANSKQILEMMKLLHMGQYYPSLQAQPKVRSSTLLPQRDSMVQKMRGTLTERAAQHQNPGKTELTRQPSKNAADKQRSRIEQANKIIDRYNSMSVKDWDGSLDYLAMNDLVITARDIVLRTPFGTGESSGILDSTESHLDQLQNSARYRAKRNMDAYLSTPKFIKYLSDLSIHITTLDDRKAAVEQAMLELNQHLPSTVYIPFINQSYRNYAVLHVLPKECRVFKTKERCPYLITIELYRPEEMSVSPKLSQAYRQLRLGRASSQKILEAKQLRHTVISSGSSEHAAAAKKEKEEKRERKRTELNMKLKKKKRAPRESIVEIADQSASRVLTIQNATVEIQEDYFDTNKDRRGPTITRRQEENSIEEVPEDSTKEKIFEVAEETDEEDEEAKAQKIDTVFMLLDEVRRSQKHRHSTSLIASSLPSQQRAKSSFKRERTTDARSFPNLADADSSGTEPDISARSEFPLVDDENAPASETNPKVEVLPPPPQDEEDKSPERQTEHLDATGGSLQRLDSVYEDYNKNDLNQIERNSTRLNSGQFPRNFLFSETSEQQEARIRKASPYGCLESWKLLRMIVKSGDDLRQEQFAIQLIAQIQHIFNVKRLRLWMFPYEILSTGPGVGIVEVVPDALSIDGIKKSLPAGMTTLMEYFLYNFGERGTSSFKRARDAFAESLAAYSLVSYILQIKDRHNANLLIDKDGHIVHIDFGFLLSNAPGKGIRFESAPFKLTNEFVQILGGVKSRTFSYFRDLMIDGFMALQEYGDRILVLVEMMLIGNQDLPCFQNKERTLTDLKERLYPLRSDEGQYKRMNRAECGKEVSKQVWGAERSLIYQSNDNWRTNMYDKFQYCCQGIF